ncbi:MAG: helix-turn-helix transcriptional regulator [Parachlamydiaceae bacterium]
MSMNILKSQLFRNSDLSVDRVRKLTKSFCQQLDITAFGYVRIYDNGTVSWITTNPDQDRFLVESGELSRNPLVNDRNLLKEGNYLDLYNRQFPGSEVFYRERAKFFQMDHGMVLVRHQKNYIETGCFSGHSLKKSLHQLFMNEQALFKTFLDYFVRQLDPGLLEVLSQGISLHDLKDEKNVLEEDTLNIDRASLLLACGQKGLLTLSKREKQCLVLLKEGHTYHSIGLALKLSERTVEHYLESVKNKLNLQSRTELIEVAERLTQLRI